MKAITLATIHFFLVCAALGNIYEKRMNSFDTDDWFSLYFGIQHWSIDTGDQEHILIQRLPDKQFLLSVSVGNDHDGWAQNLSVAKRFITLAEVNEIKERVTSYAQVAFAERKRYRERIGKEHLPPESIHTTLVMKISRPGGNQQTFGAFVPHDRKLTFDYGKPVVVMVRFDLEEQTHESYRNYLRELIHKVEPDGVSN